jgi:hypothetical protein
VDGRSGTGVVGDAVVDCTCKETKNSFERRSVPFCGGMCVASKTPYNVGDVGMSCVGQETEGTDRGLVW